MPGKSIDLDAYVTVAERISAFYDRYPDGSIQTDLLELSDSRVVVRASAYRHPEDPRPGIDHAAMTIPGSTPYTRGSEVENCSTSAVGRALAMLGFETKRGIASADEVRAKADGDRAPARPVQAKPVERIVADLAESKSMSNAKPKGKAAPVAETPPVLAPDGRQFSMGDAMEIVRTYDIDIKAVSAKGRALYGQWSLKEMTSEQRAHVIEEVLADLGVRAQSSTPPADGPEPLDPGEGTFFGEEGR